MLVAGILLAQRPDRAAHRRWSGIRILYPLAGRPGYLAAMTNWDGQWYRVIAEQGYPAVLPRAGHGGIDMNPWAFFPVFPLAVGAIMKVTGLPFDVVGPLLSTLVGFAAMFLLFKLIDQAVGRWEAIVAVVGDLLLHRLARVLGRLHRVGRPAARRHRPAAAAGPAVLVGRRRARRALPDAATSSSPWCRSSSPTPSCAGASRTRARTRSACAGAWRRWRRRPAPSPSCGRRSSPS